MECGARVGERQRCDVVCVCSPVSQRGGSLAGSGRGAAESLAVTVFWWLSGAGSLVDFVSLWSTVTSRKMSVQWFCWMAEDFAPEED
jgi:hypothetical protein